MSNRSTGIFWGAVNRFNETEREAFIALAREALSTFSEDTADRLLNLYWREQITASWFIGLKDWTQFTAKIGDLLVQSRLTYAGRGHCFALARFATEASADYLRLYLDTWLPQTECYYDQAVAMSALLWVDHVNGTSHAQTYLQPNGLWEKFVANKQQRGAWDTIRNERAFRKIMLFCIEWFDTEKENSSFG